LLFASLNRNYDEFNYLKSKAEYFGLFCSKYYIQKYPYIDFTSINPFSHYNNIGWRHGNLPSSKFNSKTYSVINNNIEASNQNPVLDALKKIEQRQITKKKIRELIANCNNIFEEELLVDGVSVCAFLSLNIGLGIAAKNLVKVIDKLSIPSSLHNYSLPGRDLNCELRSRFQEIRDRRCSLQVISILDLHHYQFELRPKVYSILYPFWELSHIPEYYHTQLKKYNEIWAPSKFIFKTFSSIHPRVTLVRQPLMIPELLPIKMNEKGSLRFLTYFDFDSSVARKNIKASIIAFQKAFPNQLDVSLTVKARGSNDQGAREWLADQAARDPRIRIIDETLSRHAVDQLMLECDAFISLHRSEGFGFGAAEALAVGKAVVSTDYSGTTDFISPSTGYPVEYDLISVKEGEYPHWENQVWADPRLESAVAALQEIYEDREGACKKGLKGRELMERLYSPAAVGAQIKNLLHERGLI
jgi:glycosyltransferase involved in cell wall biosynthesis